MAYVLIFIGVMNGEIRDLEVAVFNDRDICREIGQVFVAHQRRQGSVIEYICEQR